LEQALREERLELVPSGNGSALIDLREVSPALAASITRRGADLVVLEGMGRALESNFDACFQCDALKVAMIKDPNVAQNLGGELYDLVFRFELAAPERGTAPDRNLKGISSVYPDADTLFDPQIHTD